MTNRRQFIANVAATGFTALSLDGAFAQADSTESAWARINRTRTLRIGSRSTSARRTTRW